nr:hypothetical protein [uncultured Flavobacterium sp.]
MYIPSVIQFLLNKSNKFLFLFLLPTIFYSQSDVDKILKGGEIIVNGLAILKTKKSDSESKTVNNKIVATICVKNKLAEKIAVKFSGKDEAGVAVIKEMVIQNDGKECVFEIPKGIYTYEIVLSNKEVFQKGEYKFEDEITITVKKD